MPDELQMALARIDALADLCRQRGRVRRIPDLHLQSAAIERRLRRHRSGACATALVQGLPDRRHFRLP